jgi:type IV secretory pathway component VirB8
MDSNKKEEKMNSTRKTAIIVGVLFITATVTSSLYYVILTPILNAPDYLINVSEHSNYAVSNL